MVNYNFFVISLFFVFFNVVLITGL